jgi:hypothetical protein
VVLSAVQFAAVAKSLESSRWLQEVADKDLVDGLGDGIEGSLAVFVELRRNACVAGADWEVGVLDLGFKITDLGTVSAFVDPESDCCDELLFSETVLDFVRNKGPKDRKNILPRSSSSMRGSKIRSACVAPPITPLVPPSLRNTISTASTT